MSGKKSGAKRAGKGLSQGASKGGSQNIVGKVVLESSDVTAAQAATTDHSVLGKYKRLLPLMVVIFVVVNHFVTAGTDAFSDWKKLLPIGLFLAVFITMVMNRRKQAGSKALEGKSEEERKAKFELGENGFSVELLGSAGRSEWSSLHHFLETESAFLLYINATVCHVLPKRAFSEPDVEKVRSLLEMQAPPAPQAGGPRNALKQWGAVVLLAAAVYYLMQ